MSALDIARTRAKNGDQPTAFLHAFLLVTRTTRDLDAEALIWQALRAEEYPRVAGLIEGLAAVHAEAGMPTQADPLERLPRLANGRLTGRYYPITAPRWRATA